MLGFCCANWSQACVWCALKGCLTSWQREAWNAARNIRPRYTPTGLHNLVPTKYGSVVSPWCFGPFSLPLSLSLTPLLWQVAGTNFIATLCFMSVSESEREREREANHQIDLLYYLPCAGTAKPSFVFRYRSRGQGSRRWAKKERAVQSGQLSLSLSLLGRI